jgi:hypothetical protein
MSFRSRSLDADTRGATGSKTAAGKVISSQNARKHALIASPDAVVVAAWFKVIRNNQGGAFEAPNEGETRWAVALRLAIVEVHYHRALCKIDTHESEPGSTQLMAQALRQEISDILSGTPKTLSEGRHCQYELAYINLAFEQLEILYHQTVREQKLCQRYRSEARSRRKKARRVCFASNRNEN